MVTCRLSVSLQRLFDEFNALWPNRNRGIDGWCRDPASGISLGHNPGHNGLVHAIDVDVRGIWPPYVIDHIYHGSSVLWYVIWDRRLWTNTGGWHVTPYTAANAAKPYNPHTNHMHIEIYQTTTAEQYTGGWGLSGTSSGLGAASGADISPPSTVVAQGLGAADDRDPRDAMNSYGFQMGASADHIDGWSGWLDSLPTN